MTDHYYVTEPVSMEWMEDGNPRRDILNHAHTVRRCDSAPGDPVWPTHSRYLIIVDADEVDAMLEMLKWMEDLKVERVPQPKENSDA